MTWKPSYQPLAAYLQTNFIVDEKHKPVFGQDTEVGFLLHELEHIP